MKRERFEPEPGAALAIDPKAIGGLFGTLDEPTVEVAGDCAVVTIRGPLRHHAGWWCDSYEAIRARFDKALASDAPRVALKIDSPGGYVSGCFELADYMRQAAQEKGKPVVAYVDGSAYSAAYALACAASKIVIPSAGGVGSVGVIAMVQDWIGAAEREGIKAHVFTSGKRKADTHPMVPMDEAAAKAIQADVDGFADVFFGQVADATGLTVDEVRGLEAATFVGKAAVEAGLADEIGTFESATGSARIATTSPATAGKKPGAVASNNTGRSTMDKAILEALCGAGVLANVENATDSGVLAAVTKLVADRGELLAAVGVNTVGEAMGAIAGHKANAAKLEKANELADELTTKVELQERASLMTEHASKFTPAMQEWASAQSLESLRGFVASAAPAVKSEDELPRQAATGSTLTDDDRRVADRMGVDLEKFAADKAGLEGDK